MKRLLPVIALLAICVAPSAQARLTEGPTSSFLWNQFSSVVVIDSLALATTDFGLAALKLNDVTRQFDMTGTLLLTTPACEVKLAGDVAVVLGCYGFMYFVDISNLPELTLLGEIDLGLNVHDFALYGEELYLACGFDGLRKYSLTNYSQLEFLDSSLIGVHCIQTDVNNGHLLVLDDYNGVLKYDLETFGISQLDDMLWVPRRAISYSFYADTLYLPLHNQQLVYRGEFGNTGGVLTDSITLITTPELLLATDSLLVSIDTEAGLIELVPISGAERTLAVLDDQYDFHPSGDVFFDGTNSQVILLSGTAGLATYNIDELWIDDSPRAAYHRPGPINSVASYAGFLMTGGGANPTEFYAVDSSGYPEPVVTLNGMRGATAVVSAGAHAVAYYRDANLMTVLQTSGDTVTTVNTYLTGARNYTQLKFFDYSPVDTSSVILGLSLRRFDLWELHPNGTLEFAATLTHQDEILDATIIDDFLYVATVGQQLYVYRLFGNLFPVHNFTVSAPVSLRHLVNTGPRLFYDGVSIMPSEFLGFANNDMYKIHLDDDGRPTVLSPIPLPVEVTRSCLGDNYLFGTGPYGTAVFDLSQSEIELADYGGFGGQAIAYGDSTIAVTDGTALHLYDFIPASYPGGGTGVPEVLANAGRLDQNFPNPFNPRTRIDFELFVTSVVEVSVYDILGRKLTTLVDDQLPAGPHSVQWDGKGRDGRRVASGVYFYRMTTPETSQTRKMVMLK